MRVRELIKRLRNCDPDADVAVQARVNYSDGDHVELVGECENLTVADFEYMLDDRECETLVTIHCPDCDDVDA